MNGIKRKLLSAVFISTLLGFIHFPLNLSLAEDKLIRYNNLSYSFYDVRFLDQKTGWICGKSGLLYRTEDGGMNWIKIDTGVADSIFGIAFLDQQRGIIAGQGGLVMSTEDSGKTWKQVQVPTDKALLALDFYDDKHGMAVGDWGKIIATDDGGRTWTEKSLDEDILLYGLKFVGPREAWIAAETGALFHTTDGGQTWEKKQLAPATLFAIDFDKQGNGLAVGIDGSVVRTKNGGQNWESGKITSESLYGVRFNGKTALIVGDAGTVFRLADKSGDSWQRLDFPVDLRANWVECIAKVDDNNFLIAGAHGSICYVKDFQVLRPEL